MLPLLAHAPELARLVSSNPIYFSSGLTQAAPDGVLAGLPGWNDPNTGFTTQALGKLAAEQWLHGQIPWWNSYSGVGLPLAAEMQGSALFLPFVLLLRAADGFLYLKVTMQILAGLATFAVLRQLRVAGRWALLGGILYELNGTFAWMGHAPIMPVPFLPLLLFGIERARIQAADGRWGGWGWIAVAVAGSLYAGFPETAFIDGLMAAVWGGYRFVSAGVSRWRFAANFYCGGLVGLLLAMPVIVPFLQLLGSSYTGVHGLSANGLDPANFAMFLFPYVLGPIDYNGLWVTWGAAGGFVGLPIAFLASLALLRRGRDYGLRIVLAGWIVLALARSIGAPGVTAIFNCVPFVRDSWFGRYAVPGWELAAVLLCAWAADDWSKGLRLTGRELVLTGAAWGILSALALQRALASVNAQMPDHLPYSAYAVPSVVLLAGITVGCAWLLSARWQHGSSAALSGLLAAQALLLFMLPLLSGARTQTYDKAGVQYLKAHVGLFRFYSLGPFAPNYGAYFDIASINHNYLPTPKTWVDYIRTHLDPAADDVSFTGTFPPAVPGVGTRADAMRDRMGAYAAIGVKFVVAPPAVSPFSKTYSLLGVALPNGVEPLAPAQSILGGISGAELPRGRIGGVTVTIGTYFGAADGALLLHLCTPRQCADGEAKLAGAVDNAPLLISLSPPLAIEPLDTLSFTIAHSGGTQAAAIYVGTNRAPNGVAGTLRTPSGLNPIGVPAMRLVYAQDGPQPLLVYTDKVMAIYELPKAADYFEALGGDCEITPIDRNAVRTDCRSAARLIRRELIFPGWRARVNRRVAEIRSFNDIFQEVSVPAGVADVRFSYAPPFIGWAYAAFAVGFMSLAAHVLYPISAGCLPTIRQRFRRFSL